MLGNGKFPRKFDSPDDFLKNLSGELPRFEKKFQTKTL